MPFETFALPSDQPAQVTAVQDELARQEDARIQVLAPVIGDVQGDLAAQDKVKSLVSTTLSKRQAKHIRGVSNVREALAAHLVNSAAADASVGTGARLAVASALVDQRLLAPSPRAPRPPRLRVPPLPIGLPPGPPPPPRPPPLPPPPFPPLPSLTPNQGNIPASAPDGIYLICLPESAGGGSGSGVWTPVEQLNGSIGGITNYFFWIGPFGPSYASALLNPQYNALLNTPCTGGTIPSPPEVGPPAPTERWYCIQLLDGSLAVESNASIDMAVGAVLPDGSLVIDGPFYTQEDAQANCTKPLAIPGQTCPLPDPCAPTIGPIPDWTLPDALPCQLPANLGDTIPVPGSDDWCQRQDGIRAWLGSIGAGIVNEVLNMTDMVLLGQKWAKEANLGDTSGLAGLGKFLLYNILLGLSYIEGGVWEKIKGIIACWKQIAKLSPGCDPNQLIGIAVLKGVISILRSWKLGINAVLVIEVRAIIDLPMLDRAVNYVFESVCPTVIPDQGASIQAWLHGQIDDATLECWLAGHGISVHVWEPVIQSRAQIVSANDIILYGRRQQAGADWINQHLTERGWVREEDRVFLQALYDRLPTESQAFAWLRESLYDDELAAKWGLDEGLPDFLDSAAGQWIRAQGMTDLTATYEYRRQFTLPSPGTAREFLWRARAEVVGPEQAFTLTEYQDVLAFSNTPSLSLPWHELTAYRPLGPGDVQELMLYGLAQPQRLRAAHQDVGLREADADLLTGVQTVISTRRRADMSGGWTIGKVARQVRVGVITLQQGIAALDGQGYTNAEIVTAVQVDGLQYRTRVMERNALLSRRRFQLAIMNAYSVGVMPHDEALAGLVSAGWDSASGETSLAAADITEKQKLVQQLLSSLKVAWLRGELSHQQVETALTQAGIQPDRVQQYMHAWDMQRSERRRLLSASQVLKFVQDGLMAPQEAHERLSNLGWDNPDQQMLMAEVSHKLALARAREEAALEKSAQRALRQEELAAQRSAAAAARQAKQVAEAQAKALRELDRERRRLEEAYKRNYPTSQLKAWLKAGYITPSFVRTVLRDENISDQAIDLYLEEWTGAKPTTPATAPAPVSPG